MKRITLKTAAVLLFIVMMACSMNESPEERAVRIVKKSNVMEKGNSVEQVLQNFIKNKGDKIKAIGWEAARKNDKIYLVSYKYKIFSFDEGSGVRGYFFMVNFETETVKNVTKDYVKKMEPLSRPLTEEKELVEQILKEKDEE